jgi:hypothetical protein
MAFILASLILADSRTRKEFRDRVAFVAVLK